MRMKDFKGDEEGGFGGGVKNVGMGWGRVGGKVEVDGC